MAQAISGASISSFEGELAVLLLDNESNQSESARLDRDAARESYLAEAQKQIDALHEAADAARNGAYISAACSVVSGGAGILSATYNYKADVESCSVAAAGNREAARDFSAISDMAGHLAEPFKIFVGDSAADERKADAKKHETLAEQAKWQAGDASGSIDKADRAIDKELDLLQSIQHDRNSTTTAILGRI